MKKVVFECFKKDCERGCKIEMNADEGFYFPCICMPNICLMDDAQNLDWQIKVGEK